MKNQNYVLELINRFLSDSQYRVAIQIYDGKQILNVSYRDFAIDVLRSANYFKKKNICGKHIALIGENSYDWLTAFLAIVASGNTAVLMDPHFSKDNHLNRCAWTDTFLLCGEKKTVMPMAEDIPTVSFDELHMESPMPVEEIADVDPDATTVMMFTSGTMGKSKVAELTYANLLSSIHSGDAVFSAKGIDRVMIVLPMFHISGLRGTLAMLNRYKMLCIGRGPKYLFKDMPMLSPDYVSLVPMMVESVVKRLKNLLNTENKEEILGRNLKRICVGGSNIDPNLCRYLLEQGILIDGGYGMTETTGVGTWGAWDEKHFNTIGKLSDQIQCKIVDGELLFKGSSVMKGYYKDDEETSAVINEGWLHSGDLGYCDADGFYYITGRKKNLIVLSNGEKVNPEEVEDYFNNCPAIQECIVFYNGKVLCMEAYAQDENKVRRAVDEYNEKMPLSYQIHKLLLRKVPLDRNATGKLVRKGDTK